MELIPAIRNDQQVPACKTLGIMHIRLPEREAGRLRACEGDGAESTGGSNSGRAQGAVAHSLSLGFLTSLAAICSVARYANE